MKQAQVPSWEPHGKALLAWWEGYEDAVIGIKMPDEPVTYMPIEIYFRSAGEMPEIENYALQLCSGKTLDVGAGAGSHCLLLQAKGIEVIGLDIAPEAVNIMNVRGVRQTICGDFLDTQLDQSFDTLLFLMNGIGIAGTLNGLKNYLLHSHHLTHQNSQLLLDSSDLSYSTEEYEKTAPYLGEISYQLSFGELEGAPYKWLYVDPQTLATIADETGWVCQIVFEEEESYLARLTKKENQL